MDKEVKALLNSLRCPICGGLIDMFEGEVKKRINYACAADVHHYGIWLDTLELPAYIEEEYVEIIHNFKFYLIVQFHNRFFNKHQTNILVGEVNGDGNVIEGKVKKQFTFGQTLFDFTKVGKERLINKIKTILVFQ